MFSSSLRHELDKQIDKRLVRTFFDLLVVITIFREWRIGLFISELGGCICGVERVPAGTKRISNLLRSKKWSAQLIEDFFFQRTNTAPGLSPKPLYLVIVRDKKNYNSPMYILTSLPIDCLKQAWEVCYSYLHRWEAEQGFRFLKSEIDLESPRLWFWGNRQKLMAIVTLAYDFLLRMMANWKSWVHPFLRYWSHRTGERYRNASIPLYRLRMAISICLTVMWAQNSG